MKVGSSSALVTRSRESRYFYLTDFGAARTPKMHFQFDAYLLFLCIFLFFTGKGTKSSRFGVLDAV